MTDLIDLPQGVRDSLPSNAQGVWADAYKAAVDLGDGSEERRVQAGWDAVKAQGWLKEETGRWRKTDKRLQRADARMAIAMLGLANAMAKASGGGWSKQSRVISGPKGGQWTAHGSGGGVSTVALEGQGHDRIVAPHLGQGGIAQHRFESDPMQDVFTAPLKQTEITGKPAFLDNPHGYVLMEPSTATPVKDNGNPEDVASYIPDGDPGKGLNGIAFKPWDPPEDWSKVAGQGKFDEPPIPDAKGKRLGAGVIIEEPDGRIWTVNPLNQFGGYKETFPKGGIEPGLDLRQTAIKEAWEESGLKVELTGYLGDFERTTSVARYYRAKRVTGDPTDAHWETQAVNAVPLDELADRVVHHADAPIIAALNGENVSVQKALCLLADIIDLADYNATDDERMDIRLAKAKKGGAWQKQMRVPAGLPTGGQWTVYGSGGIGGAYAAGGVALELQKHMGTGPQSADLNAKIKLYQDAANQGYLHPDAMKVLSGPMSTQSYSGPKWQSAAEAKAYVDAGGSAPTPSKADAVPPISSHTGWATGDDIAALGKPTPEQSTTPDGWYPETPKLKNHDNIVETFEAGVFSGTYAISVGHKTGGISQIHQLVEGPGGQTWQKLDGWSGRFAAIKNAHLKNEGKAFTTADLTPLKPAGQATLASTIAQSTGAKTPLGTLDDPMSLAAMTKTGSKPGGSAAGGIHTDAQGQRWVVKSYDTPLQAQNEVAASKIYGALGVHTPVMKLIDLGNEYKGGIGVASKFLDDVEPFNVNNPAHVNAAQANFGAHALMADWDAVGANFDNIMISTKTGSAVLVDPGGAMLFRAMGTPKGALFTDHVGEINSMRDPSINPTAAKVFGPMSESHIASSALEASVGFGDSVTQIASIVDSYFAPGTGGGPLKTKLMKRAVDLEVQANQLHANFASSTGVGIAKTGTTTATPTHANPHVAAVAALSGGDAQKHIDDLNTQMGDAQMALSGDSAEFYSAKINDLNTIASTGDIDAVKAELYVPGHAKKGNKLSPNYSAYLKAHDAAVKKAEAIAGTHLKQAPEAHAGSMVTGTAKMTPAQVETAKLLGDAPKMASTLEPSVAIHIEPTPTPKPVTPKILTPAPPLPNKPFIESTPKNPNTKTIGQNDAIEKINHDPNLTPQQKVAQIHAIVQQLPAVGNTYSKKVKTYAANSIAAHGGMNALDTMPQALKTEALNDGLAKGNAAAGVSKPGVVVETKTEDLGGGITITSTIQTTTTQNPPIGPDTPFDVSTLPVPPDFFNYKGPGQPLYNTNPEFNAINNAAVQGMYAAAKVGKTELDKIDPGTSNKLIAYKASLLSAINNHASDLKAKMAAWTPTTVKVEVIDGPHITQGGKTGGPLTAPAKLISAITAGMSKPKNWLVSSAEKIAAFVKVGAIDPKLAVAIHDAIPMSQMFIHDAMAKKMTKDVLSLPKHQQQAMAAHTSADQTGFGHWESENQALYGENGPKDPHFASGMKKAKAITEGVEALPDLPVGFSFTRKMYLSGEMNTPAFWNKQAGTVINNPGISSSAIDGAWSGNVVFLMKASEGVKGAYLAESGLGLGISEILLPRNYKMVVVRATPFNEAIKTNEFLKTARAKSGHNKLADGSSKTVVEVILVPHDAPE